LDPLAPRTGTLELSSSLTHAIKSTGHAHRNARGDRLRSGIVEQALDYHDHLFINFQDYPFAKPSGHCYRWVDLKRFRLPSEPPEDVRLLDALLRHECRVTPDEHARHTL
jgi:hypothetical protein